MTIYDILKVVQAQVGPSATYEGLFFEGHGVPTHATPQRFLFYGDMDSGKVYINNSRVSGIAGPTAKNYTEVASADVLAPITITT